MMRLAIIGGQLQGTEACYLARQAGYEVLLIDKQRQVPAAGLADEFIVLDVVNNYRRTGELLRSVDLIIPANEDILTLNTIDHLARQIDRPYAFDPRAYAVSSSKKISDALFQLLGVPAPAPWPRCSYPVIIKPAQLSGSAGVKKAHNAGELKQYLHGLMQPPETMVVQEFIDGPSLSLEVIALNGRAVALQITELEFDRSYDCKRVLAGIPVEPDVAARLSHIGCQLAMALNLTGIMDIEVMMDDNVPKVIEIDARLPSQTPTAVFHSSGINMLELLTGVYVNGKLPETARQPEQPERAVIYEHAIISGDRLEITGEYVLASAGRLLCQDNLYGFDRVITDFQGNPGEEWVATLITTGENPHEAMAKRQKAISALMSEHDLKIFSDPVPAGGEVMAG